MIIAKYNRSLKERSRMMRNEPTDAEGFFWERVLKSWPFSNYTWRRQKPLENFIVDFYCTKLKLAIEIDGEVHATQAERDAERTAILEDCVGIRIIRFTNEEVLNQTQRVKYRLMAAINSSKSAR